MSMTKPSAGKHCPPQAAISNSNGIGTGDSVSSVTVLNSLRDMATILPFQECRYKDGGAHWYRSSAVLLHYHRLSSVVTVCYYREFLTTLLLTEK